MNIAREGVDTGGCFANMALRRISVEHKVVPPNISTFLYVISSPLYGEADLGQSQSATQMLASRDTNVKSKRLIILTLVKVSTSQNPSSKGRM